MAKNQPSPEWENQYAEEQAASGADPTPPAAEDPSLLNEIIEQTQQTNRGSEFYQSVVEFAKRYPEQAFSYELLTKLMEWVLKHLFPSRKMPPGCAEWIAEILFNDSNSRRKIQSLWQEASEESQQ